MEIWFDASSQANFALDLSQKAEKRSRKSWKATPMFTHLHLFKYHEIGRVFQQFLTTTWTTFHSWTRESLYQLVKMTHCPAYSFRNKIQHNQGMDSSHHLPTHYNCPSCYQTMCDISFDQMLFFPLGFEWSFLRQFSNDWFRRFQMLTFQSDFNMF